MNVFSATDNIGGLFYELGSFQREEGGVFHIFPLPFFKTYYLVSGDNSLKI